MKTHRIIGLLAVLALLIAILPASGAVKADTTLTTINYGDITLPGTYTSLQMPDAWDMNQGPVVITYTLDLSGAPNVAFNWNWDLTGIVGLFDPGKTSGARMTGFLSDWGLPQFPTYPDNAASYDTDDKFNLQRFPSPGNWDETMYDVRCDTNQVVSAFGSGNNYGIWFDRDGVDEWQDDMWGMVNGGTYNTTGVYPVQLTFRKNSPVLGTACPLMFPALTNTWVAGGMGIPTGFYSAGWKPTGADIIPAGLSFASDAAKMRTMHVVVEGASDGGAIIIRDLTVTGYLADMFSGFLQPIDTTAVNTAKAGQTIPVKWQLLDELGAPISDPASFVRLYSYRVDCDVLTGDPLDAIEEYTSGSSGLQYQGDGYWQFSWKTPKTYVNTCRAMYVEFQGGGTSPLVNFKFK